MAVYLGENRVGVTTGSSGGSDEIFYAECDVTTYQEVRDAVDDGKTVMCKYSPMSGVEAIVPLTFDLAIDANISAFAFSAFAAGLCPYIILMDDDEWQTINVNINSVPEARAISAFDTNAKMNSTDMTDAQIDDFVDGLILHGSGGLNTATFTATSDANGWFQVPSTYNNTIIVWSYVGTASVTERGEVLNTAPSASNRYSIRFKQWDDQIIYKSSSKTIRIWYINK